jgi:hypothetical protein
MSPSMGTVESFREYSCAEKVRGREASRISGWWGPDATALVSPNLEGAANRHIVLLAVSAPPVTWPPCRLPLTGGATENKEDKNLYKQVIRLLKN